MRLLWTSDIHLNHVDFPTWDQWVLALCNADADGLLITGDISESNDVYFQLRRLADAFAKPIYFVLGNHDFYGSSIAQTRQQTSALAREVTELCYLTDSAPIAISDSVYLLGEDGWGDGTRGDYDGSPVRMQDFEQISDFHQVDRQRWQGLIQQQGRQSAERLKAKLASVPDSAHTVYVATHVPPFCEACWYQGRTTDENWAPFFVCGQVGDTLLDYAAEHPHIKFVVLCGHTHYRGTAEMLPNLVVHTAAAEYAQPAIESSLEIH